MARALTTLRKIVLIPWYSRQWWRALDAQADKNWGEVVQLLRAIHEKRLATGDSRSLLAYSEGLPMILDEPKLHFWSSAK